MKNNIKRISLIVLPVAAVLLMLHFFNVSNQKSEEIEQLMTEYVSLDRSEELAKTFVSIVETYEEQTDKLIDSVQQIEREKMRHEMARQARIILNQQIFIQDTIQTRCDTIEKNYDSLRALLERIDTRKLQQ